MEPLCGFVFFFGFVLFLFWFCFNPCCSCCWLLTGPGGPRRPARRRPRRFRDVFFIFFVGFVLLVGYGPGWSRTSGEARAPAVRDVQGRPFCFFLSFFFSPSCGSFAVLAFPSSVCSFFFCVSVTHKQKKKPKQNRFQGPGRSRTSGSARDPAVRDVRGTETLFFCL